MEKTKSRVQKTFLGQPSIETRLFVVAQALNGSYRGMPNDGRYSCRLLLLLIKRFQIFQSAWKHNPDLFFERRGEGNEAYFSEFASEKYSPIMRLLKRFRATPGMNFGVPTEEAKKQSSAQYFLQISWTLLGDQYEKNHELFLVLDIMEIAQAGRIDSLKQCENCRKWLFARFPHQRFCSENCKEHFHRSNEADKKRRREWARQNYRAHKALDAGSRNVN